MNRAALLSLSHDDLIALILAQQAQIEAQAQQISILTARIAELETRLAAPAKTPDNSSIPPSKGQKSNLPDRPKKPRGGHPGVARALAEHPDRIIEATLAACPHCAHAFDPADLPEIHAYDHIDLPPLRPIVTRVPRPASTAIVASVPAARSVLALQRQKVSRPARRSGLAFQRSSSTSMSPRRSVFSASPG